MISRRPNSLASTENAPGPRKTMARVMMKAKRVGSLASNKFGLEGGSSENPMPTAPRPSTTATSGVRIPINKAPPAATPNKPAIHAPAGASPCPVR